MGQYRQWLHYREVDQQLHSRLEQLTDELIQLQEQALHLDETATACPENTIIQALARQQEVRSLHAPDTQESHPEPTSSDKTLDNISLSSPLTDSATDAPVSSEMPAIPISPTLFAWGHLPNFDSQKMQISPPDAQSQESIPPTPHPDRDDLLPQDMGSFFDEHGSATPQLKLPIWLEKAISSSTPVQHPVDQQSVRTNRLIQRWVERWGRASNSSGQREEQQHEQ